AKLSKGSQLKKIASVSNQKSLQKLPSCAVEFTRSGFPITAGLTMRARRLTGRTVCGLCTASSNTIYFDDRNLLWNLETKRLGSLEIDHHLKLGRLYDRQIGRFFSFENSASVNVSLFINGTLRR